LKRVNIMEESHKVRDIEVIKYFKCKQNYIIYKKSSIDKVYLARIEDSNFVGISKDESKYLQEIIKVLLSTEKDFSKLEKFNYKELDQNQLATNYSERGSQTIEISEEQYNNLCQRIICEAQSVKKIPLIILLIVLIAITIVINYFVWFKDGKNPLKDDRATVSFITNSDYTIEDVLIEKGQNINLNDYLPTKEGYIFIGWYTDSDLTNLVTNYKVAKDVSFYAKWESNQ